MTFGELIVTYSETCVAIIAVSLLLLFFYRGHAAARCFISFIINIVVATVEAINGWVKLFEDLLVRKDDENGCKDM